MILHVTNDDGDNRKSLSHCPLSVCCKKEMYTKFSSWEWVFKLLVFNEKHVQAQIMKRNYKLAEGRGMKHILNLQRKGWFLFILNVVRRNSREDTSASALLSKKKQNCPLCIDLLVVDFFSCNLNRTNNGTLWEHRALPGYAQEGFSFLYIKQKCRNFVIFLIDFFSRQEKKRKGSMKSAF